MTTNTSQQAKAQLLHKLHHSGEMLLLPNIWDTMGAAMLEQLQYPAIATSSSAIALANGYQDGEKLPFNEVLALLTKIAASVHVPVTADVESAYAHTDKQLQENIRQLIATGIVGINIEDSDKKTNDLIHAEKQCERIRIIKDVSASMGVPLFINARADVYVHGEAFETPEAKLEETLKRGLAYKNAGADCFFPILMKREQDIRATVEELGMPVNIMTYPGIPELAVLKEIGVARVSLGGSFQKIAVSAMKNLATRLQGLEGLSEITGSDVTSDYLRGLVKQGH